MVYGRAIDASEDTDDDMDDDDREITDGTNVSQTLLKGGNPSFLQPMTSTGGVQQRPQTAGTNAKTRELARRRKQAFALRGDKQTEKVDNEPSIITQSTTSLEKAIEPPILNEISDVDDSEPWLQPSNHSEPRQPFSTTNNSGQNATNGSGIVLEALHPVGEEKKKKSEDSRNNGNNSNNNNNNNDSSNNNNSSNGSWVPTFGLF